MATVEVIEAITENPKSIDFQMDAFETDASAPTPIQIIQPCSEACICFQRLASNGWSDFGVCTNPESPFRGFPVQIGRECRNYQSSGNVKVS